MKSRLGMGLGGLLIVAGVWKDLHDAFERDRIDWFERTPAMVTLQYVGSVEDYRCGFTKFLSPRLGYVVHAQKYPQFNFYFCDHPWDESIRVGDPVRITFQRAYPYDGRQGFEGLKVEKVIRDSK